jgi:hypothetical protein
MIFVINASRLNRKSRTNPAVQIRLMVRRKEKWPISSNTNRLVLVNSIAVHQSELKSLTIPVDCYMVGVRHLSGSFKPILSGISL